MCGLHKPLYDNLCVYIFLQVKYLSCIIVYSGYFDPIIKKTHFYSLCRCFKKKSNGSLLGNHNWQCLRNGEVNCASSKLLFLKVIRYDLGSLDRLMTTHPDLAILYLTRDPRAVLHSQTKAFGGYFRSYLQTYIEKTCQMRERDLLSVFAFAHKFPHRIKVVRYEDLVQSPTFVARKLFDFVGLSFTDNDAAHVRLLAEANDANNTFIDMFSVARANSSATAYTWREQMDWNLVTLVQKYCYTWMADLGYKHVTDLSELRNQSLLIKDKVYISRNIQLP